VGSETVEALPRFDEAAERDQGTHLTPARLLYPRLVTRQPLKTLIRSEGGPWLTADKVNRSQLLVGPSIGVHHANRASQELKGVIEAPIVPRSDDPELSQNAGALFVGSAVGQQALKRVSRGCPVADAREDLDGALSHCVALRLELYESRDGVPRPVQVAQRTCLQIKEPMQERGETRSVAHASRPLLKEPRPVDELPSRGVETLEMPARFLCVWITAYRLEPTGDRACTVVRDVREIAAR